MLIPQNIKEKWYSNPKYYDSTKLMELKADDEHSVDIAFIFSGRNRGKSFGITCGGCVITNTTKTLSNKEYIEDTEIDFYNGKEFYN